MSVSIDSNKSERDILRERVLDHWRNFKNLKGCIESEGNSMSELVAAFKKHKLFQLSCKFVTSIYCLKRKRGETLPSRKDFLNFGQCVLASICVSNFPEKMLGEDLESEDTIDLIIACDELIKMLDTEPKRREVIHLKRAMEQWFDLWDKRENQEKQHLEQVFSSDLTYVLTHLKLAKDAGQESKVEEFQNQLNLIVTKLVQFAGVKVAQNLLEKIRKRVLQENEEREKRAQARLSDILSQRERNMRERNEAAQSGNVGNVEKNDQQENNMQIIDLTNLYLKIASQNYWNEVATHLKEGNFDRLLTVLTEIKTRLCALLPPPKVIEFEERLDFELLSNIIINKKFNGEHFMAVFETIWSVLRSQQAPRYDDSWKQWYDDIIQKKLPEAKHWAEIVPEILNKFLCKLDQTEDEIAAYRKAFAERGLLKDKPH